ncbi:MAG: Release factor glutamine methyltransferase [Pseudomonadota bacterium]|nr:Release factor glutamine methyltransferase [Pseudomonadota bacterium]
MNTIKKQLNSACDLLAHHSPSPRLDAEVLLAFVLGKNRSYLRAWDDKELELVALELFTQLVEKRRVGVPIAYLTERREFWSRDFKVSSAVLIPRPETELLIELCLERLSNNEQHAVLDLGTGSGAIAITLAAERPLVQITAIDKSVEALDIAKENAARHDCQHIEFVLSDWLSALSSEATFDFILSNPPYIAQDDVHLSQGDVRFEPMSALVAADNGLYDIKKIASDAKKHLRVGGQLWFEHGYNQAQETQVILKSLNYCNVKTYVDLSGQPRVTMGFI